MERGGEDWEKAETGMNVADCMNCPSVALGTPQSVRELQEQPWLTDSHLKGLEKSGSRNKTVTFPNTPLYTQRS